MGQYISFIMFAISALISPGPNNLMIMYSGLNFGYKKSLKHAFGIILGAGLMLLVISLGFGFVFVKLPWLKLSIKIVGSVYMLFLAYKLARMKDGRRSEGELSKPLTVFQAALFQLVNPKAWVIMIAFCGMVTFNQNNILNSLILVSIITLLNIPSLYIWLSLGTVIEKVLSNKKQRRTLNYVLGLLLAISVIMLWN